MEYFYFEEISVVIVRNGIWGRFLVVFLIWKISYVKIYNIVEFFFFWLDFFMVIYEIKI